MTEPIAASRPLPNISKVKRVDSNRVRRSFVISSSFALFSSVLCLVAMQMPQWFVGTAQGTTVAYGIGTKCTDGLCLSMTYADEQLALCTISGASLDQRSIAVRWLLYVGIGLSLISVPLYLVATFRKASFAVPSLICQVLSFLCTSGCIVLFAVIYQNWLFCGTSFCKYVFSVTSSTTTPCFSTYGTGYIMTACGTCFNLIGSIFAIAALAVQRKRQSTLALVVASRSAQFEQPDDFEAPEGFMFDPASGLYYSEESQLYLDPDSCHYYDPSSGLWYDTGAELWYEIKDQS